MTSLSWRYLVRKTVVVNLFSGRAFVGILWEQRGPLLVLRKVTLHEPGGAQSEMDGEVVVERDQVEFIQVTD